MDANLAPIRVPSRQEIPIPGKQKAPQIAAPFVFLGRSVNVYQRLRVRRKLSAYRDPSVMDLAFLAFIIVPTSCKSWLASAIAARRASSEIFGRKAALICMDPSVPSEERGAISASTHRAVRTTYGIFTAAL